MAFLGVLIKQLVESGWSIEGAWNAVCNDSRNLGHYWNSAGALHKFEPTGSREICGFCDLGNAYKILAEDKETGGFWLAGGAYHCNGINNSLADLSLYDCRNYKYYGRVGWLVLEA